MEFVSDHSLGSYNFEVDPSVLRKVVDFLNFVHPCCRGPWFKSRSRVQIDTFQIYRRFSRVPGGKFLE